MSPFKRLGVAQNATDDEIRLAYLQKIKEFSPEQDPETFRLIHQAFEAIKTEQKRQEYALFSLPDISLDDLVDIALQVEHRNQLDPDYFFQLLNESAKRQIEQD